MAPYDVPHVTHDMMLRFMKVNFSSIIDGSAKISSNIGSQEKPVLVEEMKAKPTSVPPTKTPEQDKAMWEGMFYCLAAWQCPINFIHSSILQRWVCSSRFTPRVPCNWDFHLVPHAQETRAASI
jgi:hypothetical protein